MEKYPNRRVDYEDVKPLSDGNIILLICIAVVLLLALLDYIFL